ncbi:hypothetical protein ACLMJK_004476 [Lecanora helva]
MLSRFRIHDFLIALVLFITLTSAWPWPPSLKDMGIDGLLVRRQDDQKSDATSATKAAAKTASPASTAKSAKQTAKASDTAKASNTARASGTAKGTAKASGSAAATTGQAAASSISVNPVLPAGGFNMITPSSLGQSTYYKIGEHVTFAWNYTSLSIKPSKIDAIVTCSQNDATYTLLSNASFEKTGSVVWDTKPEVTGTAPLLTETYTLIVYDAAEAVTAVAGPGRLGTANQFRFGMYLPQTYTKLSDWKCSVCNAALSDTERQAMKFMFGMCLVTVLSFTWFVSGLW